MCSVFHNHTSNLEAHKRYCLNITRKERIFMKAFNRMKWSEIKTGRIDQTIRTLERIKYLKERGQKRIGQRINYPDLEFSESEYESETTEESSSPMTNYSPNTTESESEIKKRPKRDYSKLPMPHQRIRPVETTFRKELPMPHKRIRPEENKFQKELPMPHKRIPDKEPIWNTYRKKYPLKQTVTLDDVSSDSDLPTDDSRKRDLPKAKNETPSLTSSLPPGLKPTGPSLAIK